MDAAVGRLVDTLRAVGALDNTLVSRVLLDGKYLFIALILSQIFVACLYVFKIIHELFLAFVAKVKGSVKNQNLNPPPEICDSV